MLLRMMMMIIKIMIIIIDILCPESDDNHSPPHTVEVKKEWS